MKNRLVILGVVFCLMSFLLTCVVAKSFVDVSASHWAYPVIQYWSDNEIIAGYTDGSFGPDRAVTRAEFATILARLLEKSKVTLKEEGAYYMDLTQFHWAYSDIQKVSSLMSAENPSRFQPDKEMRREDVAMALVNVVKQYGTFEKVSGDSSKSGEASGDNQLLKQLDVFYDKGKISENRKEYVANAVKYGLMKGNEDSTFLPQGGVTRAELLQALYNMIHSSYLQKWVQVVETSTETTKEVSTSKNQNTRQPIEVPPEKTNTVVSNPQISLKTMIGDKRLYDGGSYSLLVDDEIEATIENPSSTLNYLYYMIAYGSQYQETIVKKVASATAKISMPEKVGEGIVKLTVWGTSNKQGKGYVTNTEVYYIRYTSQLPEEAGTYERYEDQTGIKVADRKVDFIVVYRGDNLVENEVVEKVRKEHRIVVRGKPVVNMESIEYKWDKEKTYTVINQATTVIDIPSTFEDNTTHQLTIRITDKQGRTYMARNYYFVINGVLPEDKKEETNGTTNEETTKDSKDTNITSKDRVFK